MDLVRLLMSEVSDSSLFLYLESIAFHIFIFKEFRGIANKTVKNIGNFNLSTYTANECRDLRRKYNPEQNSKSY